MVVSIEVDCVTKEFDRHFQRTLKQVTVAKLRGQETKKSFLALKDVSFTVEQGEAIGLMGLNGSGKSTLLKHVMGVMRPTSGQVRTRGRVSGLIATGAGFHPQMTGRENIFMNAAILGMTKSETEAKFDDIAGFADVGEAMDTPVGNYSSGMFARLGFAVAVHVDCDVFIADEVLAVGDQPFKKKCMKKMEQVRDSGVTLFYVSHAAQSVRKMCSRVIVLEKGVVGFDGDVNAGIKYLHYDDSDDVDPEDEQSTDAELGSDV
ncbi:MAG TPA: ABC transporter ATP-binding protein [Nocardioides sp.]|uniref:ABC transporter ATP-binding protein n=1 Tax=uncultured Nocardioides sp. TaxID=198441 RepID=UPI000ECB8021|nr:ABC transporter ATP-binding protein [uncultured Nocardioides sp.]HCB04990.1 ABC transporter ATP-binding protein [Nocardioides sp.]HRD62540.1 ABC transporter ATP-binding protein [Nocardioides sp.]HRI98128.1 ABC transporter ATP-binding protein [Nocardioides sp.]